MEKIKILIVDDHPIMRTGIAALIASCGEMVSVGQAATGEEAVEKHALYKPNVTLIDLCLPGISGIETIRRIRRTTPDARCIVLTVCEGDEDIHQAMEAGAKGYLVKGLPQEMLMTAIKCVHEGGRYMPPHVSQTLAARTRNSSLSAREREVLTLVAKGRSNKEIAIDLGLSGATVKCYISLILLRLNATDRTQAVIKALQRGFIHV